MKIKCLEWNSAEKQFAEVDDPVQGDGDLEKLMRAAGYVLQLSSVHEATCSAGIEVFAADDQNIPKYYVSLMGQSYGFPSIVARDFMSLLATLRELQPLLDVMRLDQAALINSLAEEVPE